MSRSRLGRLLAGAGLACAAALLLAAGAGCAGRPRPAPAGYPVSPGPEWPELPPASAEAGAAGPSGPEWPDLETAVPLPPVPARPPILIRVGLAAAAPRAVLACAGEALLLADAGATRLARLGAGQEAVLVAAGRRLRWSAGGAQGECGAIVLQPVDPDDAVFWGDGRYRGEAQVLPGRGGLSVVNAVPLESYLRGVVPWEIGRVGPPARAALEAQSIAARTYTVAHRGGQAELGFDVWADTRDQVYRGLTGEDSTCNAAITRTAGLVLRSEGREIEAFYSATCGGCTARVEDVWPRPARPYLRNRLDSPAAGSEPFCAGAKYYRWEVSWGGGELERVLQRTLPEYLDFMSTPNRSAWAGRQFSPRAGGADARRPGRLLGLAVRERAACGRITRLDVETDAGTYHVRGDRVRWVLAPPGGQPAILYSALFGLAVDVGRDGRPHRVTARGRGYGHGVGLCQEGAIAMARRGFTCGQILAHYYPGALLTPLEPRAGEPPATREGGS